MPFFENDSGHAGGPGWHGRVFQDQCMLRSGRSAVGARRSQGRRGKLGVRHYQSAHTGGARQRRGSSGAVCLARALRVNLVCWRVRERGPCLVWVSRHGRCVHGCGMVCLEIVDSLSLCFRCFRCCERRVDFTPRGSCNMRRIRGKRRARPAGRVIRRDAS